MYRLGCCIPGASFMPQTGGEKAYAYDALIKGRDYIIGTGFDFAEATVGTLIGLSEDELDKAADSGVFIEVCNSFVPPSLPLFGTDVSVLRDYVSDAMRRMAKLKTEYVILGSGQARSIPKGVSQDAGISRVEAFLSICSEFYFEYGIKTALEPLNSKETNCVNTVREGFALVRKLNLPGIFLLADSYHMFVENEPPASLKDYTGALRHIHISGPDRKAPGKGDTSYLEDFAKELKKTSYSGKISVECVFSPGEFYDECPLSYKTVKRLFCEKGDT